MKDFTCSLWMLIVPLFNDLLGEATDHIVSANVYNLSQQ